MGINFDEYKSEGSIHNPQVTRQVSVINTKRLMLLKETVSIYCENRTELTDSPSRPNAELLYVKVGDANKKIKR